MRCLPIGHDGFRFDNGREHSLRIYQAIKYRGWFVYDSLDLSANADPG